jgi:tetratricopeptide (TPR) repeat protein
LKQDAKAKDANLKAAKTHILEGEYDRALDRINEYLRLSNGAAEALYMKAVCERYTENYDDARSTLELLKSQAPEFGRAYQEEGHVLRALGQHETALAAYQQACRFNPMLEPSWRAQSEILNVLGRQNDAASALAQVKKIARTPKALVVAANLLYEGRLLKAEEICRAFLQKNPRHVEGMRLLAEIGVRFSVYDDAEFLLESALSFEPDNIQVHKDYISVLRKRQKYEVAHTETLKLYNKNPSDPFFQSQLAIDCMHIGAFDQALSLFDQILEQLPDDPATLISRGHALKTHGRRDDAVESYRAAIRVRPGLGDAYYGLANLKTYRFTEDEIGMMRDQEANGRLPFSYRIQLCFSLGKAFEDQGDYATSFEYYEKGNNLKLAQCRYNSDEMSKELQSQADACTEALFHNQRHKGANAADPIFIVGLPRAGSTLLEQILASHSQVDGTFELPNILAMAHRLRRETRGKKGETYPQFLRDIEGERLCELGEQFIEDTRIHRQGAPYFTDKMPNNFRHIGLIHLILPNAKIIDARREPMACCFSGFKQLFAEGQEFTYGLEQVGNYYRDYVKLMRHWDDVLPDTVLRVQHEDVLDDLEGQVRRMLEFCSLPFEQSCIDFYKTERSVRTASSEQVRQPISKSGVDQWRNFEQFLDPLKKALGPALTEYRN